MKTLKFVLMAIVAMGICANFTSCSDDDGGGSGSSSQLLGKWTTDWTYSDYPINQVYTFNADGTYSYSYGAYETVTGRYTYKYPIITFSETDGGTYIYTIVSMENDYFVVMTKTGNSLTFKRGVKEGEKQTVSGKVQNHDYVDLGLSVKWATCNVGASKITDGGDIYAWGETYTKNDFTWDNYKLCKGDGDGWYEYLTKYVTEEGYGKLIYSNEWYDEYFKDDLTTLEASDDVATAKWGSQWRMPTKEEFEELVDKCSWDRVNFDGYVCHKVTGPSGKSIFFVAKWPEGLYKGDYYWTSTLDAERNQLAYNIFITSNNTIDIWSIGSNDRYLGRLVRPVTE